MKITIYISEDDKVAADIRGAIPAGDSVENATPSRGEATFPVNNVAEEKSYDAGAAPGTVDGHLTTSETEPISDLFDLDGGEAPKS